MTSSPVIRTLLLCDLIDSTALVERAGDSVAADFLERHDRMARDLLTACDGLEIDKSDGFMLLFERPTAAVRFALAYQDGLARLATATGLPWRARVGIHLGEVVLRENAPADVARGAKPLEVEGLAKVIAARIMALAEDGRILLSGVACELARRGMVGAEAPAALGWFAHGPYRLAGVTDAVAIHELTAHADIVPDPPRAVSKAWPVTDSAPGDSAPGAGSGAPVLAVLAFDNLSNDPEMQFFSDGVSDEIIERLTSLPPLRVIGRTSSFQLRGEQKARAAALLRCTHVLDGSVRRAAQRVRVSAQLIETRANTTLWSQRFDQGLEDIFAVQDEIAECIAAALDETFTRAARPAVDPAVYDLYLRAQPQSFAPDELRVHVATLEAVVARAPGFAPAWGRLAFLRGWLHFYLPFADRPASAARVHMEAGRALELEPQRSDALAGLLFVNPPFGRFDAGEAVLERLRAHPTCAEAIYVGWYMRTTGRVHESVAPTELAWRLDTLNPMATNLLALAYMAAGRTRDAVPLFEDLVERMPGMSFPVSSLLRAHAFLGDWPAVDRLLALAEKRELREFREGLPFIRAKRDPTPARIAEWRDGLVAQVARSGGIDLSRLVYAAHLGLVDEAYDAAAQARLGPAGGADDVMGPDGYRTSLLFQVDMPELRNDPRFADLCARLGLVEFWLGSGQWPDCRDEVPYDFVAACAAARAIEQERCDPAPT
ncbi:MAG: hypothetical protein AB7Q81_22335 [Gammaproteobacteria bacterium]